MIIYVVAVGRVKSNSIRDACRNYTTRVRHYLKLEMVEVRDGGRSGRDATRSRRIEGDALLKSIPDGVLLVALSRSGAAETSIDFARRIGRYQREDRDVAFAIGGAHGLDQRVLDRAGHKLSLSQMTLPHELARLALLEQIYRACTILRGEPYHKGG